MRTAAEILLPNPPMGLVDPKPLYIIAVIVTYLLR